MRYSKVPHTLHSSMGFHTLSLTMPIDPVEHTELCEHFKQYSKNTQSIKMYYIDSMKKKSCLTDDFIYIPLTLNIIYHKEYTGISWKIHTYKYAPHYAVEVTINPKFLSGNRDYLTAATYDDINKAIAAFNEEAKRISPILKDFEQYKLTRIDYCVNFDLSEIAPQCSAEQLINLIKRSDIPPRFNEWKPYDEVSHRKRSQAGSFYLVNNSVTINCYSKYMQLLEQQKENADKYYYHPIPQSTLDAARNIIRFEVQCKYLKVFHLSQEAESLGDTHYNKYRTLLTESFCDSILQDYYYKTIGRGFWRPLQDTLRSIYSQSCSEKEADKLSQAVQTINQCRSIAAARTYYEENGLKSFNKTLRKLREYNINPVTIPKDWNISYIPDIFFEFERIGERNGHFPNSWSG